MQRRKHMTLNSTQRAVLLAGIAVIVLMGVFPPWTYTFKSRATYSEEPAGYSFIASPPSRRGNNLMHGVKIDMPRLVIQWVLAIAASGFGVLVTTKQKDGQIS